jgi:hypothetical protein
MKKSFIAGISLLVLFVCCPSAWPQNAVSGGSISGEESACAAANVYTL